MNQWKGKLLIQSVKIWLIRIKRVINDISLYLNYFFYHETFLTNVIKINISHFFLNSMFKFIRILA